jgi:hypothetical protein
VIKVEEEKKVYEPIDLKWNDKVVDKCREALELKVYGESGDKNFVTSLDTTIDYPIDKLKDLLKEKL